MKRRGWKFGAETCSCWHLSWIVFYDLCFIVFYKVYLLVIVLNLKKIEGMKNKMLSQIRALSNNRAWSLRYLFSHAWCFLPLFSELICLEAFVNKTDCF